MTVKKRAFFSESAKTEKFRCFNLRKSPRKIRKSLDEKCRKKLVNFGIESWVSVFFDIELVK
jgi:hypothetical protein